MIEGGQFFDKVEGEGLKKNLGEGSLCLKECWCHNGNRELGLNQFGRFDNEVLSSWGQKERVCILGVEKLREKSTGSC